MLRAPVALIVVGLVLALLSPDARTDHLPDDLLASEQPETGLAGIDLTSATLKKIVRLYGAPTRHVTAPNNPTWTGYVWELPGAKLEVSIQGHEVLDVYVEGVATGPIASTMRGVRLGDDLERIRHIYGSAFQDQTIGSEAGTRMEFTGVTSADRRITIQWRSQDFTLTIGLNANGLVSAMWLLLPECYPDGCE